jgi:hypothetical protein
MVSLEAPMAGKRQLFSALAVVASALFSTSVFAVSLDQNNDTKADLLWRNTDTGENWFYLMDGAAFSAKLLNQVPTEWQAHRGDFNGDGTGDIVWRNANTGLNWYYQLSGSSIAASQPINTAGLEWSINAIGDFNGDGNDDILWRNSQTGLVWLYQMQGHTIAHSNKVATVASNDWQIVGHGDFNNDSTDDILWRNAITGANFIYLMASGQVASQYLLNHAPSEWKLATIADVDGDGDSDLIWRNTSTGLNWIYQMQSGTIAASHALNTVADQQWQIADSGDYNGDGTDDVLWRHQGSGKNVVYFMANAKIQSVATINSIPNPWSLISETKSIQNLPDFDNDGIPDVTDPDDDNDGALDIADGFPFDPSEQYDFDGDGVGNNADEDDDGDGFVDGVEDSLLNLIALSEAPIQTIKDRANNKLYFLESNGRISSYSPITGQALESTLPTVARCMSLSPDNKELFVVRRSSSFSRSYVSIYDASTLTLKRELEIDVDVIDILVLPNNKFLTVSGSGWDLELREQGTGLSLDSEYIDVINLTPGRLALHADGKTVFSGVMDQFEVEGNDLIRILYGVDYNDVRVWLSPSDDFVYTESGIYRLDKQGLARRVLKLYPTVHSFDFEPSSGLMLASHYYGLRAYTLGDFIEVPLEIDASFEYRDTYFMAGQILAVTNTFGAGYNLLALKHPCLECSENIEPIAELKTLPTPTLSGVPYALDASDSRDVDGDSNELLYRWDLNSDGLFDTPYSSSSVYEYIFPQGGIYDVTVQVRDNKGKNSVYTRTYDVTEPDDYSPFVLGEGVEVHLENTGKWQINQLDDSLVLSGLEEQEKAKITFDVVMEQDGVFYFDYSLDTTLSGFVQGHNLTVGRDRRFAMRLSEGLHQFQIKFSGTGHPEDMISLFEAHASSEPSLDEIDTYIHVTGSNIEPTVFSWVDGVVEGQLTDTGWLITHESYTDWYPPSYSLINVMSSEVGHHVIEVPPPHIGVVLPWCRDPLSLNMDVFEASISENIYAARIVADCASGLRTYNVRISSMLPSGWYDLDFDGTPDSSDPDIDNDGILNNHDLFPTDASEWSDDDLDGVGNNSDAFPSDSSESLDTDSDGIGNNADTDDDGDGVKDEIDGLPLDANYTAPVLGLEELELLPNQPNDWQRGEDRPWLPYGHENGQVAVQSQAHADGTSTLTLRLTTPTQESYFLYFDYWGVDYCCSGAFLFRYDGINQGSMTPAQFNGEQRTYHKLITPGTHELVFVKQLQSGIPDRNPVNLANFRLIKESDIVVPEGAWGYGLFLNSVDVAAEVAESYAFDFSEQTRTYSLSVDSQEQYFAITREQNPSYIFPVCSPIIESPSAGWEMQYLELKKDGQVVPMRCGDHYEQLNGFYLPVDAAYTLVLSYYEYGQAFVRVYLDRDRDGVSDGLDPDIDGDGVENDKDHFPLNPFESADSDLDGIGNNADAFPFDASEWLDTDGDLLGNNADTDDDNDGVPDDIDGLPLDPSYKTPLLGYSLINIIQSDWTPIGLDSGAVGIQSWQNEGDTATLKLELQTPADEEEYYLIFDYGTDSIYTQWFDMLIGADYKTSIYLENSSSSQEPIYHNQTHVVKLEAGLHTIQFEHTPLADWSTPFILSNIRVVTLEEIDNIQGRDGGPLVVYSNTDPYLSSYQPDTGKYASYIDFAHRESFQFEFALEVGGCYPVVGGHLAVDPNLVYEASCSGGGEYSFINQRPGHYKIELTYFDTGLSFISLKLDTDGDGVIDTEDPDIDGDGFANEQDAFPSDIEEWLDSDSDGVGDNADALPFDASETLDTDGDGIGNNADNDDDNDGIPDVDDCLPLDASPSCVPQGIDLGVEMFIRGIGGDWGTSTPLKFLNSIYETKLDLGEGEELFRFADADWYPTTNCGIEPATADDKQVLGKTHELYCAGGFDTQDIRMDFTPGWFRFRMSHYGTSDGQTAKGAFYVEKVSD